jgi:hypothetical protein
MVKKLASNKPQEVRVAFVIDEIPDGYLHISWPYVEVNGTRAMATLSYWKPTIAEKARIIEAVFNEDFKTLSDIWDIHEGSRWDEDEQGSDEQEEVIDFGRWKH